MKFSFILSLFVLCYEGASGGARETRAGYTGQVCSPELVGDVITLAPPLNHSCQAYFWTAQVEDGYFPDVTLEALRVDEALGEFLLIGPGRDLDTLWADEGAPMFTGRLIEPRRLRVFDSSEFCVMLVTNPPGGADFAGNLTVSFKAAGLIDTTPAPTTPPSTLPTPPPNTTADIAVFLGGRPAADYSLNATDEYNVTLTEQLREAIADMAMQYDTIEDLGLAENITAAHVVVSMVRSCPAAWTDAELCVQVNISVAAVVQPQNNYEMSTEHLRDMWTRLDTHDPRLDDLQLYKYTVPDATTSMWLWLGLSFAVLLGFIAILVVVWRVEIWDYRRMRSESNANTPRGSALSTDSAWFPEHQLVPPYMEAGYVEYEPEFDGPAPPPKYAPPKYAAPTNFGGAVHFYGNNRKTYNNPAFIDDEEEVNTEVHGNSTC